MAQTFYDVLDVSEDALQEEIQDAYREKVKEYHPDVSDKENTGEVFKRVVRAEEVLGDPDEREKYDRLGHESYVNRVNGRNVSDSETSPWTTGDNRNTSHDTGGFDPQEAAAGATGSGGTTTGATADHTAHTGATGGSKADSSMGYGSGADRQHGTAGFGSNGDSRWDQRSYSAGGNKEETSSGYSVHDWDDEDLEQDTVTIQLTQELLILATGMFVLYPVFVWASVTPSFPIFVNVPIAAMTLLGVGYLLTVPKVGVAVFGGWSVIAPVGILALTNWNLMLSLFALGVCWVPFAYAVVVAYVVRPG